MGSKVHAAPVADKANPMRVGETSLNRSHPRKKIQGKVPKRIHKAEREKMKREHLNELFLALADALELTEQNNGKASILGETTRFVKDMLVQIECLRRENADLLSESQYVTTEKNEIQDENYTLQDQIGKLQIVLKDRMAESKIDLNITPLEFSQEPESASCLSEDCPSRLPAAGEPALQQTPIVSPVFVIPAASSDLQVYPNPDTAHLSSVRKPHARYPTPADSWPSKILEKQSESGKEFL